MYRDKIVSVGDMQWHAAEARRRGERIVLANGCFDILHVGHVRYLQGAKKLGGFLAVAVNSDASVRKLKGPSRPILTQEQRAELVAALRCVDRVVLFDEPDVKDLIALLRPDFHAKGTDYTEETVPERQWVLEHGGQVRIVGDAKGHSTRDLLTLVRSKYRGQKTGVRSQDVGKNHHRDTEGTEKLLILLCVCASLWFKIN